MSSRVSESNSLPRMVQWFQRYEKGYQRLQEVRASWAAKPTCRRRMIRRCAQCLVVLFGLTFTRGNLSHFVIHARKARKSRSHTLALLLSCLHLRLQSALAPKDYKTSRPSIHLFSTYHTPLHTLCVNSLRKSQPSSNAEAAHSTSRRTALTVCHSADVASLRPKDGDPFDSHVRKMYELKREVSLKYCLVCDAYTNSLASNRVTATTV